MLIIALRLVDLIPNGRWTSLPTFLAGALYSSSLALSKAQRVKEAVARTTPSLPSPLAGEAPAVARAAGAGPSDTAPAPAEKKLPPRLSDTLRRRPESTG
jgi:hypothetical protein